VAQWSAGLWVILSAMGFETGVVECTARTCRESGREAFKMRVRIMGRRNDIMVRLGSFDS